MLFRLQNYKSKWKLFASIFFVALLLSACSHEVLIKPGDSFPVAFHKAVKLYHDKHYDDAAKAFQTVITSGRGTKFAKNSQYFLAQSYYKSGQYLLAADAYQRFITLYPKSTQSQMASYKEGLCYYKLSPRYAVDQSNTHKAIQQFNLFIAQYPQSNLADKAGKYVSKLRDKLAHKIYNAGQLYFRLDQYKAAVIYYDLTVDQYPDTPWAEQSLVQEIATYVEYASKSVPSSKRKRYKKALDTYQQYLQLFPKGKHHARAKANAKDARKALAHLEKAASKKTVSSSY